MYVVEDVEVNHKASVSRVVVPRNCVLCVSTVGELSGIAHAYTHRSLPQVFVQRITVDGILYHLLYSWYVRYAESKCWQPLTIS